MSKRVLIAALVGLAIGIIVGFWIGRAALEAKWSEPMSAISSEESSRLATPDANPVPKAGTKLLGKMPLNRARPLIADLVKTDPVVVTVGALSADSSGERTIHLRVENRGDCAVKSFSGVAYAFRSDGRSGYVNEHKEHFVAFAFDQAIAPKAAEQVEAPIKHVHNAAILLAHVDAYECANGKKWARN